MSEGPESRDSENNWVIPSAESLVVETVGTAHGGAEEAAVSEPAPSPDSKETAHLPDVKLATEPSEGPAALEEPHTEESHTEEPDEKQVPPPKLEVLRGPSTVGEDLEEVSCSSSEDDVEGLRKRVGRGAPPVSVGPSVREVVQRDADTGSSFSLNALIIAAISLICIGLLVFSGGSLSSDDDPTQTVVSRSIKVGDGQSPQVISDIQEWIEHHADQFTGDPSSLQAMSRLLDKVAKENQEIGHMQAKLQAQKEELEALLSVSDRENITPGSQGPGLPEENVRLKDALLKEETAHLSAKEELQNVQEKLEVLEGSHVEKETLVVENSQLKVDLDALRSQIEGFLSQKETLVAESQMLRQELDKQRLLVASIRQELENLVIKSTEGGDDKLLQERLSEMSSRLAMEAQRSESWEKTYVEHAQRRKEQVGEERRDHGHKGWKKADKYSKTSNISTPVGDFKKPHYKHGKEHGKRWTEESHRESQHEEWRSKKHNDRQWRDKKQWHLEGEKAGAEIPEERDAWKNKAREHRSKDSAHHRHDSPERQVRHHQGETGNGYHPRKGQREFTDSHKRQDRTKGKDHLHHDHNKFWKKLSDHQYRVPVGCSGLEDCARKDGVDLFNVELKPVQRAQFEEVLLNYLAKTQLSEHLPELTPLLDGFFEGPLFSHHKIRFKDFVDDVEDFLEDLARKETGNDDIVDDFERYVYTSFFGEAASRKRYAKKHERQKTTNYHKPSGKLEKTYDWGLNQSDRHPMDNIPKIDNDVDSHDFKPIKKHKTHEKYKPWSLNPQYKEESDHKYENEDNHNPKNHHRSPRHNDHDENGGSFHHHHGPHAGKKFKYPHTKPGGDARGHHNGHHHIHEQYKEYQKDGDWQKQHQGKHKYDSENPGHQNTYKKQKSPQERFGKELNKYKHKNPDKYKEDVEHKQFSKKHEKDANNKHYRSSQRLESQNDLSLHHKPLRDGDHGHRHKNFQGSTQHYPSKAYYQQREDHKSRHRDYRHKRDGPQDRSGNYHQKYEQAKDRNRDYQYKYDKDHHKHGNESEGNYHPKHDKDNHKHDRARDLHNKYDKNHHQHDRGGKYDKDNYKHDRDGNYHQKYDKDYHKHRDDSNKDYHKYKEGKNKDGNYKHDEERRQKDYHHKHDAHHNAPRKF